MARKKQPTYNFNDFFGNANQYHLMGAQTSESFFVFLATLERYLKTDVHFVGVFEYNSKDYDCQYQMAFARLSEPCDITLVIMENKTKAHCTTRKVILPPKKSVTCRFIPCRCSMNFAIC